MNKEPNYKAMLAFQKEIEAITKDKINPHFKSNYATISQVLSEVKPLLAKHGLIITQPIQDNIVYTIIMDDNGNVLVSAGIPFNPSGTPQQIGSAITYYRRYTLTSLLALEVEEDDGNKASKPIKKPTLLANTATFTQAVDYLVKNGHLEGVKERFEISEKVEKAIYAKAGI